MTGKRTMSKDETYLDVYNQDPGPIQDQAIRAARDALAVLSTQDAMKALRLAVWLAKEWGPRGQTDVPTSGVALSSTDRH
jgi:hypothetical protein